MILLHGTCLLCTSDLEEHGANICNARVQSLSVLVTVGHREKTGDSKGLVSLQEASVFYSLYSFNSNPISILLFCCAADFPSLPCLKCLDMRSVISPCK